MIHQLSLLSSPLSQTGPGLILSPGPCPSRKPTNKYAREFARALLDHGLVLRTGFHLERLPGGALRYPALSNQPHKGSFCLRPHGVRVLVTEITPPGQRSRVYQYRAFVAQYDLLKDAAK